MRSPLLSIPPPTSPPSTSSPLTAMSSSSTCIDPHQRLVLRQSLLLETKATYSHQSLLLRVDPHLLRPVRPVEALLKRTPEFFRRRRGLDVDHHERVCHTLVAGFLNLAGERGALWMRDGLDLQVVEDFTFGVRCGLLEICVSLS